MLSGLLFHGFCVTMAHWAVLDECVLYGGGVLEAGTRGRPLMIVFGSIVASSDRSTLPNRHVGWRKERKHPSVCSAGTSISLPLPQGMTVE